MAKGTITKEKLATLTKTVQDQFKVEIDALTGRKLGLSKKQAADIIAGHSDGMRNIIIALRAQGILDVTE